MKLLRALFKSRLRAAFSIVVIVLLLLIALFLVLRRDVARPDASDMQFVRRQPAAEDNGFFDLEDPVTALPTEAEEYVEAGEAAFEPMRDRLVTSLIVVIA